MRALFGRMADQARQPNASADKLVVLLMDGQESLWKAGGVYLPEELAEVTEILDLLHALGYLREAAPLFHPNDGDAARTFVKAQARRMLHGGAPAWPKVIGVEAQPTVGAAASPRRGAAPTEWTTPYAGERPYGSEGGKGVSPSLPLSVTPAA